MTTKNFIAVGAAIGLCLVFPWLILVIILVVAMDD